MINPETKKQIRFIVGQNGGYTVVKSLIKLARMGGLKKVAPPVRTAWSGPRKVTVWSDDV